MRMNDKKDPGPVRRHAGDYLADEFMVEFLGPLPAAFAGSGLLVGAVLAVWIEFVNAVVVGTVCLLTSVFWWFLRSRRRRNLEKGHVAERQIGRALEQVLTANNCAVAHNVEGVASTGDIDHIVATPRGVWVVETKYRRVPNRNFPYVLKRIGANVARLRELLPPDTPVNGCLVLAYETDGVVAKRDGVRVYNYDTFSGKFLVTLRNERRGDLVVNAQVAGVVWRLGRGDSVENDDVTAPRHGRSAALGTSGMRKPDRQDEIRRRFPKAYERWSEEDDRELRRLHAQGWSDAQLGEHFGRKPSAIGSRLGKLAED